MLRVEALSNELPSTRAVSANSKKRRRDRATYCVVLGTVLPFAGYLFSRSLSYLDDDTKTHLTPTNTSPADNIDFSQLGEYNAKAEVILDVNAGEMPRKRIGHVNWNVQETFDFENVFLPGNLYRQLG